MRDDLLKDSTEGVGVSNVPIPLLRSVAGQRNLLAHAHFDQNPYGDEYDLIDRKDKKVQLHSAETIDSLVRQINAGWQALRGAEAYYDFCDLTPAMNDFTSRLIRPKP
jgi:hypothetical protein